MINSLMENIKQVSIQQSVYGEDLIRHLVNAILVIAARNIAVIKPREISANPDARLLQILDHIQENIRKPDSLKIAAIAEKFGFSSTYMGSYFRKHCNESLQQYVSLCRIRLIEHRLRYSDKRVHEIADEFGFADESHINKFFKRHKKMTLKKYRTEAGNQNLS